MFVFNIIWALMIVNQLIQFCTVNILLLSFSFCSKCITFLIFSGSLSLEMLFLEFKLLNLHLLNFLNEFSLSLSILNSFFSPLFFLRQFYDPGLYLCLLMRVYLQLNLCFHTLRVIPWIFISMRRWYSLPKWITRI